MIVRATAGSPDRGFSQDEVTSSVAMVRPAAMDFNALYANEFGFVWRCLRALGVASADLDDATQEVFMILHRRLESLSEPETLRGWIYGVVRNVAANHKRGARRKAASVTALEHEPTVTASKTPLDDALAQEATRSLEQFLAGLDSNKREVFLLAEIEEWTMPEVAKVIGVPVNTAYTRLRSARLEFERFLNLHRSENDRA